MRYSFQPRDKTYVKGYGFVFFFAKNMGKNLSSKYSQTLLDSAKKSITDAINTASKRAIQKTVEATGDLIGNKIADKTTSVSKKSSMELRTNNYKIIQLIMKQKHQKKDTYLQKKGNKLLMI